MFAVDGYFDGTSCVAVDTSNFHTNQRLVITALDEDYAQMEKKQDVKHKLEAMHDFFGCLTHEEAEDIRNNRVNFSERF